MSIPRRCVPLHKELPTYYHVESGKEVYYDMNGALKAGKHRKTKAVPTAFLEEEGFPAQLSEHFKQREVRVPGDFSLVRLTGEL